MVKYECSECGFERSLSPLYCMHKGLYAHCAVCKEPRQFGTCSSPEPSGNKYLRKIPTNADGLSDVYHVLIGFDVVCHPTAHAIKKLLVAGKRGKGDRLQDLKEARDAITRAIEEEERK